jgi:Cof subfamily protein (haloacid dehalogenase superfamily)
LRVRHAYFPTVIRPAVAVRLIALDLDGTVIGSDLIVRDRVRQSVIRAQAQGIAVTIVTGRMFAAALPFARELGITGPIVCYQGAGIFDVATGALIEQTPLAQDVTRDVLAKANADHFHAQCYADDRLYVEEINEFTHKYTSLSQVEPVLVPSLRAKFAEESTLKIVLVDEAERATAYTETLKTLLGSRAYVTRSHPDFVEILDPHVDKGRALRYVANHYGVAIDATLAVGDSWNDMPLLTTAGMGIAMGSAPPEVLARADAVVGDVAHDGVAEAIERYALA